MARGTTFTTYLNAKTDSTIDRAFAKLQTVATGTYGTISRAAVAASAAQVGLIGGRGTAGLGTAQTRALTDRATAIKTVGKSATETARGIDVLAKSTRREGAEAATAAKHNQALARSLQTTATALNVVQGPLGPLAGRVGAVATAVEQLTGFRLGLVGVGAALFGVARTGNQYALLKSQLDAAFTSQSRSNTAMNDIIGIAQRARVSLESVTGLYIRLSQASEAAGISQAQATRVTEIAAKAAALSGGSSQAQGAALTQFTQAFGADFKGGGQEIQSILEGANQLAVTIAKGFQNADGSIGTSVTNLKKLGEQGELSAAKVADALIRMGADIDNRTSSAGTTLTKATQSFSNSLIVLLGRFDQAVGFTSTLAGTIQLAADNLRGLVALAVGFGAAFAASRAVPFFTELASKIRFAIETTEALAIARRSLAVVEQTEALADQKASADSVRATNARIAALKREEAEVAALAEEKRAAALVANQQVASARSSRFGYAAPLPGQVIGPSTEIAEIRAQKATRDLVQVQERQRGVTAALKTETGRLATETIVLEQANYRARTAVASVLPKVGLLGTAFTGLKTVASSIIGLFGGSWGIAIAAATTALYLLATAESAAEVASRKNEAAQRDFANTVDRTTGKVYGQIGALELLAKAKVQADAARASNASTLAAGREFFSSARSAVAGAAANRTRVINDYGSYVAKPGETLKRVGVGRLQITTPGNAKAQQALALINQGFVPGNLNRVQGFLAQNAGQIPGLAGALPQIGQKASDFRTQALGGTNSQGQEVIGSRQSKARARVSIALAQGKQPSATDLAQAFGEAAPGAAAGSTSPRTASQRAALDRAGDTASRMGSDNPLVAARGRRDDAYKALAAEKGLTDDEYKRRRAEITTTYETERTQIAATRKEASAARAAGKRESSAAISDAKQEARQAAEAKKDNALADLYDRGLNPQSEEYKRARDAILNTYDEEIAKVTGLTNQHKALAAANEADAKATATYIQKQGDRRDNILAGYTDDSPASVRGANQIRDLQRAVGTVFNGVVEATADNPLGKGLYTQEIADADARRIRDGIRKPLEEVNRSFAQELEINRLRLQGRDAEADALRTAFSLHRDIKDLSQAEYEGLVRQEEANARINDQLAARARIVSAAQSALDEARDSITKIIENPGDTGSILKNLSKQLTRASIQSVTEKLFAGSDEKLRALLSGRSSVDTAINGFAGSLDRAESGTGKFATAVEQHAARISEVTSQLTGGALTSNGAGDPVLTGGSAGVGGTAGGLLVAGTSLAGLLKGNGNPPAVTLTNATTALTNTTRALTGSNGVSVSGTRKIGATVFETFGANLDKFFAKKKLAKLPSGDVIDVNNGVGQSTFFKGIGKAFGTALQGAGEGAIASGFVKALGVKQSKTGAQIGGAIGSFLPIPGGSFIGGIIGGTIGGLFKKTPKSSSTISVNSAGELVAGTATGSSKSTREQATGLAGAVASQLTSIAEQLGGSVTGAGGASIGTRKKKFVVDFSGQGRTKGAGTASYDTEEEAIRAAVSNLLKDGVIGGISDASRSILASGQDLQRALMKATAIESIPKRLLAKTDPTRYAVQQLNDEFTKLISYLKEGGATAAQFADAQKLYDLERADAIKQATDNAASAIDAFLKDMIGGSNSPYNKRTTYENAASELEKFKADIAGGKVVDQQDLLAAARNFQDASRALNGSSESFFADFEMLRSLLTKARDNAGITDVTTLPASPFSTDKTVQDAIAGLSSDQAQAIRDQTGTLMGGLSGIAYEIGLLRGGGGGDTGGSTIELLPGFGGGNRTFFDNVMGKQN